MGANKLLCGAPRQTRIRPTLPKCVPLRPSARARHYTRDYFPPLRPFQHQNASSTSRTRRLVDITLWTTGALTLAVAGVCYVSPSGRNYVLGRLSKNTQESQSAPVGSVGIAAGTRTTDPNAQPESPGDGALLLALTQAQQLILELQSSNAQFATALTAKNQEVQLVDEHNRRTHRVLMDALFFKNGGGMRAVKDQRYVDVFPISPVNVQFW